MATVMTVAVEDKIDIQCHEIATSSIAYEIKHWKYCPTPVALTLW